jgi:hypothetical protein
MSTPRFETRAEVIDWIKSQTHCGLQHAQEILRFVEDNSFTLRDQFAAKAMPELVQREQMIVEAGSRLEGDEKPHETDFAWDEQDYWEKVARGAYAIADAMMFERTKDNPR